MNEIYRNPVLLILYPYTFFICVIGWILGVRDNNYIERTTGREQMQEEFVPKIIAVAGKQFSGKDHIIDLALEMLGNRWVTISTSPFVIKAYCDETGLNFKTVSRNKNKHRSGLQKIGEKLDLQIMEQALASIPKGKNVLLQSVRKKKEFDFLKDKVTTFFRVVASKEIREERAGCELTGSSHSTETGAYNALRDYGNCYVINNNDASNAMLRARLLEIFEHMEIMAF